MPLRDAVLGNASGPEATRGRWSHYAVVLLVFSVTGLISALFSRVLLSGVFDLEGNLWSGPWSYRATYLLVIPPSYSLTLVAVGSMFGKHDYFKRRVIGMWSRLIPMWMLVRLLHGPKGGAG
jgi:hypothetical protein